MSIKNKMRPAFQRLEGGLFTQSNKADVGDALTKMRENNIDLMSWADPFYPNPSIPSAVMEAAQDALSSGFPSHYTMPIGSPDLKRLIAKKIERFNGLKLDPMRNIIINPGSDTGLMFAMMPFINPGDEVMVHDPSYPNNFLNPELLGGVTVKVPTYPEDNYRLRIEEYEKRLTPKTKMVLLSNPNNPTGTSFLREDLEKLAKFIIENDLVCVCDQAFEDLVFPEHEMVTMAALDGMFERTVTVCSVSKGLALSGFRVGYTFASDIVMDAMFASAVSIQGAASTLSQIAVMPAFEDETLIPSYMAKYAARRKYAYDAFNAVPGVSMAMPDAGFYGWINISKLGTSAEITAYLADEAKVSCNDGSHYGAQGEGYIRLIYGVFWENADTFNAIDRIAAALKKRAEELGIGD